MRVSRCTSPFAERVRGDEAQFSRVHDLGEERGASPSSVMARAAKGNTLLNYCGVRSDMIDYTVDRSPHKQNRLLPGTRIPIFAPEKIRETRPDYVLILPWNLRDEIIEQMSDIRVVGRSLRRADP